MNESTGDMEIVVRDVVVGSAATSSGGAAEQAPSPKAALTSKFPISLPQLAAAVVVIAGVLAFAYFARSVALPLAMAWVIAMALKPPMRWLRRRRLPAPAAAAVVLAAFVAAAGSATWYLGQPAMDWINSAPESLTRLKHKFRPVLQPAARLSDAASSVSKLSTSDETAKPPQAVEVKDNHVATTVVSWTSDFVTGAGKTLGLVFLLLAFDELFMQKFVRLLPTLRDKKQAVEITREVQQRISTYLFSIALINVTFGAVLGLVFFAMGLPNPWMWGAVAALTNFVPYFGPLVGIVVVMLAGLSGFDRVLFGLLPALAYFGLHLIEANLVTPSILGRRFTLNPVVIFLALIFFLWLWGVVGALVAVPILTTLKALAERLPALSALDEFLSH